MTAIRATAFPTAAAAPASFSTLHDDDDDDKKKKTWTNLNSDAQCLRRDAGWSRRAFYAINLRTGFYTLNPRERASCYCAVLVFLVASLLCTAVFVRGMVDGFVTEEYNNSNAAGGASSGTAPLAGNASTGAGNVAAAAASVLEQARGSSVPKVEL